MKKQKLKTADIHIKCTPEVKELALKLSIIYDRSVPNLIANLLKEESKKYGLNQARVLMPDLRQTVSLLDK